MNPIVKRKVRHGSRRAGAARNDTEAAGLVGQVTPEATMMMQSAPILLGTPYFGTPQPPVPEPFPQPGPVPIPPQPDQPDPMPIPPQPEDPIQTPDTM